MYPSSPFKKQELNNDLFELREYDNYSFDEVGNKKRQLQVILDQDQDNPNLEYLFEIKNFLKQALDFLAQTNYETFYESKFKDKLKNNPNGLLQDFDQMNSAFSTFETLTSTKVVPKEKVLMSSAYKYIITVVKKRIQELELESSLNITKIPGWNNSSLVILMKNYSISNLNLSS